MVLSSLLFVMFQSCNGNEEPILTEEEDLHISSKDSVAFIEIMKAACGSNANELLNKYEIDINDPKTWVAERRLQYPVEWKWNEANQEYRIVNLYVVSNTEDSRFSRYVWDLDCLESLYVGCIAGDVPPRNGGCPMLSNLQFDNSFATSLPDDIFEGSNLETVQFYRNFDLKTIPESLLKMKEYPFSSKFTHIWMTDNGFEGAAPVETNREMSFSWNNFTYVDWERLRNVDFREKLMHDRPHIPYCDHNMISGEAPDWVLQDTLATIYVCNMLWDQRDGYGITNLPDGAEYSKMKTEYAEHHPEFKRRFSK